MLLFEETGKLPGIGVLQGVALGFARGNLPSGGKKLLGGFGAQGAFYHSACAIFTALNKEATFYRKALEFAEHEQHLIGADSASAGDLGGDAPHLIGCELSQYLAAHVLSNTHQEHGRFARAG